MRVLRGPGNQDEAERDAERSRIAHARGLNPEGVKRQLAAIIASGDRTAALRSLRVPALVIHGDADPLVRVQAGIATAAAIPGARLLRIADMGHALPRKHWPALVDAIATHAGAAGCGGARRSAACSGRSGCAAAVAPRQPRRRQARPTACGRLPPPRGACGSAAAAVAPGGATAARWPPCRPRRLRAATATGCGRPVGPAHRPPCAGAGSEPSRLVRLPPCPHAAVEPLHAEHRTRHDRTRRRPRRRRSRRESQGGRRARPPSRFPSPA